MHNDIQQLDKAIELLLEGVSLSVVIEKYPDLAEELRVYEQTLKGITQVKSEFPNKEGLQRVLKSLVLPAEVSKPSPYLRYFAMYRGAVVLPLLFVILISAGVFIYPSYKPAEPFGATAPVVGELQNDITQAPPINTELVSGEGGTVMQKSFSRTSTFSAPVADTPVDPNLDQVFAYSDAGSNSRSEAETLAAKEALNDATSTAPFANTYDEIF